MARAVSEQYRDELQKKVREDIQEYMEAKNIIGNVFNAKSIDSTTVKKVVLKYFAKVAEASLSSSIWDPAKTNLVASEYANWVYSCGLEDVMAYEDWDVLMAQNIITIGLDKIPQMTMKQLTHYFFNGKQYLDNGTRADSPNPAQYNYAMDPGTGNGTLERPLEIKITGLQWNTAANIRSNVEGAINTYLSYHPDADVSRFEVFYPAVAQNTVNAKKPTSGDGLYSGASIFQELGIPADQIHAISNIYLPTNVGVGALAPPATSDFDIIIIDKDNTDVYYTVEPIVNTYFRELGSLYPEMVIQANVVAVPFFKPIEGANTGGKIYKGVIKIDGIST
jgi:hypothetical protein